MVSSTTRRAVARVPLCAAILLGCVQLGFAVNAATVANSNIAEPRIVLPPGVIRDGESGTKLLHDYGAFRLYRVDAAHLSRLASSGGNTASAGNTIEFNSGTIDTSLPLPSIPSAFRPTTTSGATLQMVQFVGPIAREWIDGLRQTGAEIVQYIPNNTYVVLADESAVAALDAQARAGTVVQYSAPYAPYYKLGASIAERVNQGLSASRAVDVTVQVVTWSGNAATKSRIEQLAGASARGGWQDLRGVEALTFQVEETDIATLAQMRDVFAVEEYVAPVRLDEVQDQIVAGNLSADQTGPSAPGYFSFLSGLGFPTDPAQYPIVDVADDGIGDGTTTNGAGDPMLTQNGDGTTSRLLAVFNCTNTQPPHGQDGHGHLNTGIVGGFDNRSGFPYVDPLGYLRGLGINPYARLAHTKIFADGGSFAISRCGNSVTGVAKQQNINGGLISSNSWGAAVGGAYNSNARAYDISTRDSNTSVADAQPMIFVFSAGNSGPTGSTVGSPGTAKNVITVGASENKRPSDEGGNWTDGCGVGPTGANSAMDVINFSSRGPAAGNRVKPEVIAPGTHVQAGASVYTGYDGTGVCDKYRPSGQTVFAASSGTSHSAPAVSGMVSLVYWWLQNEYADTAPSAAMAKAYLMANPTYLTGTAANDNLPSNKQGYGMPNLGNAFDATTQRLIVDQTEVLDATGQTYTWTGLVADPSKPLRVAMAYSDAPGATSGAPQVNNLDLFVQVGSSTYLGNHFTGQWSTTGGSADSADNYEAVFLQPGTTGTITITITATNIAGDGVPGVGDGTDQDFALVCSNCAPAGNVAPVAVGDSYAVDQDATLNVTAPGVLGNDTDANSDPLTAIDVTTPTHGTLTLNPDGSFSYTPNAGYTGSDSFTYKANDGTADSNVATVSINVQAPNQNPVATDDSYTANEDTPLNVAAPGVLGNDSDPDGDPLTAVVTNNPANGSLSLASNGSFTYTPNAGYIGPDGFKYEAHDNRSGVSNVATVNITVQHVNQAPTANGDSIAALQGAQATTLVGGGTSVLANDTDPDGDTLTATVATGPSHGTLTLNTDGTFLYTNDGSSATSDSFTYQACDPGSACSTGTVSITIDLTPTIACTWPTLVYAEGDAVNLELAALFHDPEGQTLTYSITGTPASLAFDGNTGVLSGTLAAGDAASSPYIVVPMAHDPGGALVSELVNFVVLPGGERVFGSGFDGDNAQPACEN